MYLIPVSLHILLITISNVLVQYPFTLFGFHTTYGAFTYPIIFFITDLTTRIYGPKVSRKVIFKAMCFGFVISYVCSVLTSDGSLTELHSVPLRVAFACFSAYVIGQLLDINVFQRYRDRGAWWVAPFASSSVGNVVDTFIFFTLAFYKSSDPFLSVHWPEIALVDLVFKFAISSIIFVPLYGVILNIILNLTKPVSVPK